MATHSCILAWRIPWIEKLGWLHPWDCKESDTTEQLTVWLLTSLLSILHICETDCWSLDTVWAMENLVYPPIQFKSVEDHLFIHKTSFTKKKILHSWAVCLCAKSLQSCLTLCNPMNCSLPASVHVILQARILEWVVMLFSRGSSKTWDRTQFSHIAGGFFTVWATRGSLTTMIVLF